MKHPLALLAAALAFGAAAQTTAPLLSKDEMQANLVRIEEQYDQSQARCKRVEGHSRELCNERARGERDVQVAELQFRSEPTPDNDEKLRLARAEARYSLALIGCKDFDGQSRVVCRNDARRARTDAKSEAKLQRQVAEVTLRSEGAVRARTAEAERVTQQQLAAARQRCEALPPEGRLNCMEDVRARFALP
ncbi:hypothetical protein H8N03_22960 [Ramlibacter sp. USB13]|uniref:DUF1311 domain-containing protein n=1 Tax=Ramlibacter cellulosilyticus TaxID=2764187 RepID=A0A923MW86_9BURK|nr:hypothetical protein [Ramlibacter cellulosilyticus]MBC5785819.1 hypothetical protein [Ramlibacter cellulosilyticus]